MLNPFYKNSKYAFMYMIHFFFLYLVFTEDYNAFIYIKIFIKKKLLFILFKYIILTVILGN